MKTTVRNRITYVTQDNGPELAVSDSKVLLEQDGLVFKNFEKDGVLKPYEDHRLSPKERAEDLAQRLSREEIAGLMLYSSHQNLLKDNSPFERAFGKKTYDGKTAEEAGVEPWDLADQQKEFLKDGVRHVLVAKTEDAETCARWVNEAQAYCEKLPFGIPVNVSSDPRHGSSSDAEYNAGAGSDISRWPETIGLAASFDPALTERFGEVMSDEYRRMGITTALSPQIDLATEPRWNRFNGTFGPCKELAADLARAYCDGIQTSDTESGWGMDSVNAMIKHWPGGGTGEGGRDAHFSFGKYSVYPGNNFEAHLIPFTEGALKLNGKTKMAASVMPYYTISWGQGDNGENVGNSYSRHIITDLLRNQYHFEGVVCTDWGITKDEGPEVHTFSGKCWGVEQITEAERHAKILEAGVDQFGGNNDPRPLLQAFAILDEKHGTEYTEKRIRQSAARLLLNFFRTGLYENPYLDPAFTKQTVGNPGYMKEGFEAQKRSITLLKNRDHVLPLQKGIKVYIPMMHDAPKSDWWGNVRPAKDYLPVNRKSVGKYFEITDDPNEADAAIVIMRSPDSAGYDTEKKDYIPISLQYRPYQAMHARKNSVAKGEYLENDRDRSYYGKTSATWNESDLDVFLNTAEQMQGKPVIAIVHGKNPMVFAEFEGKADAILFDWGVSDDAWCELACGMDEPSGLLPCIMPENMDVIDEHCEDLPADYPAYTDSEGNTYAFGFGLNYEGVIEDERKQKYSL